MIHSLAADIAAWLATRASLTVGTDLFVESFPESAGLMSCVKSSGGLAHGEGPVEVLTVQVVTRGPSLSAAGDRARLLHECVYPPDDRMGVCNVPLAHWLALNIASMQPPAFMGTSESGQFQWVFNLMLRAVPA